MSRSRLVLDTSPLVFLAKIDALPLVPQLAEGIMAPAAVVQEILAAHRGPGFDFSAAAPWLQIEPDLPLVPEIAGWDLGAGESQVLAHALARPGWEAVLDDAEARYCARSLGLPVTGTLGILLRAKKAGLISQARPLVEKLVDVGAYLAPALVEGALHKVGE